jgi:hypothetical protein
MEEAKRFMRYVFPGLTFFLEVIIAFYLRLGFPEIEKYLKLDLTVTAILASGVIGYIFSNLYYCYFWKCSFNTRSRLNYKKVVEKSLEKFEQSYGKIDLTLLKQRDAFIMLNSFWQINKAKEYGYIENQVGNLNNILHSLGTAIVLIILGWLSGMIIIGNDSSLIIYITINAIVSFFLLANYRQVRGLLHSLYISLFDVAFNNKKHNH